MGQEHDDYADDNQPSNRDPPILMPSLVVVALIVGSVAAMAAIVLFARVFGVRQ